MTPDEIQVLIERVEGLIDDLIAISDELLEFKHETEGCESAEESE